MSACHRAKPPSSRKVKDKTMLPVIPAPGRHPGGASARPGCRPGAGITGSIVLSFTLRDEGGFARWHALIARHSDLFATRAAAAGTLAVHRAQCRRTRDGVAAAA